MTNKGNVLSKERILELAGAEENEEELKKVTMEQVSELTKGQVKEIEDRLRMDRQTKNEILS